MARKRTPWYVPSTRWPAGTVCLLGPGCGLCLSRRLNDDPRGWMPAWSGDDNRCLYCLRPADRPHQDWCPLAEVTPLYPPAELEAERP